MRRSATHALKHSLKPSIDVETASVAGYRSVVRRGRRGLPRRDIWRSSVKAGRMTIYRHTDSGLKNVLIEGANPLRGDSAGRSVMIPNIDGLRKAIAHAIVARRSSMSGKEMRFLRSELRMTQSELAFVLHCDALAISRWERGEVALNVDTEAAIRLLAIRQLRLPDDEDAGEIAGRCRPSAKTSPIMIDGSDPSNYRIKRAG